MKKSYLLVTSLNEEKVYGLFSVKKVDANRFHRASINTVFGHEMSGQKKIEFCFSFVYFLSIFSAGMMFPSQVSYSLN